MKKRWFWMVPLVIIFIIFLTRLVLPSQVDDINPGIYCEPEILEKVDVYYVIPEFEDVKISENLEWCKEILEMDKDLRLHGIKHTYKEFEGEILEEDLIEAMEVFENCFGKEPENFKPSHLSISKENKKLVRGYMNLDLYFNQLFHKVYHCGDTGAFRNGIVWLF